MLSIKDFSPHDSLVETISSYDASFALYKPININNQHPAPTKVFENEYFGLPTIVFSSNYIDELIEKKTFINTISIKSVSVQELKSAVLKLEQLDRKCNKSKNILWQTQSDKITSVYNMLRNNN